MSRIDVLAAVAIAVFVTVTPVMAQDSERPQPIPQAGAGSPGGALSKRRLPRFSSARMMRPTFLSR